MSRCLTDRSIDHVVLERGEVANSWRTERWDSLRLLTPNWMTRLPGITGTRATIPDGYMTAVEVAGFLDGYARRSGRRSRTNTTVESVRSAERGFTVTTDQGVWTTRSVVVATGACSTPRRIPRRRRSAARLGLRQLDAIRLPPARPARPTAGCSWSAPRPRARRSPTSCSAAVATSCSPSATTPGCPAPTEAWTSTGGCTASACSTSATTRSRTSPGPAGCRRCS